MSSDSFAGIAPASPGPFVIAEALGGVIGAGAAMLLQPSEVSFS
jgi:hypothetical protein